MIPRVNLSSLQVSEKNRVSIRQLVFFVMLVQVPEHHRDWEVTGSLGLKMEFFGYHAARRIEEELRSPQ